MRKLIIVSLLIITVALGLTACAGENPPAVVPPADPFVTPGFVQAKTASADMIKDLIYCTFNTIKPLTSDDKNKTDISLSAEAEIDLNGVDFLAVFKLNYSPDAPEDMVFNLELLTGEGREILIAVYYYRTNNSTDMYLRLRDNKIKVTIPKEAIEESGFPLDVKSTLSAELDTLFTTILTMDGEVRYEYANFSGGRTRHYLCRINIPESLKKIINISNLYDYDITDLNFLMQNLLGVTANDITHNRMPNTFLELEFITKGGSQGAVGNGVISSVNLKVDVAASANVSTVFMGEAYTARIDINKLEVNRFLLTDIMQESALSDYADYTNKAFRFEAEVLYGVPQKQYLLTLDFSLHGEVSSEDRVAAYLKDKASGQIKLTLFYENNIVYINLLEDNGDKRSSRFDLTLTDLLEELRLHGEESESAGLMKVLVYVAGSLRMLDDMQFAYNFVAKNIFSITGLNAERLITMLDAASADDLKSILENGGLGADKLSNLMFSLKLDLQSNFIKFIEKVELPEDKGSL